MNCWRLTLLFLLAVWAPVPASSQNPNLVHNGSFENPKNTWVNSNCNYMSLLAGATDIPHWTVTVDTINEIVWASALTCDGYSAAAGKPFKQGSTTWIPENGSFTAQSTIAALVLRNTQPGAQIGFVDKVAIRVH